jgi:hypothetical protein
LRAFRGAVERHRENGSRLEDLRTPLRQFCAHARRERMAPEQVVIRVKYALEGLHPFDIDHAAERESVRTGIITFAIKTYYEHGE